MQLENDEGQAVYEKKFFTTVSEKAILANDVMRNEFTTLLTYREELLCGAFSGSMIASVPEAKG